MSAQGMPLVVLLLRPLWIVQFRPVTLAVIGVVVGVALFVAWRSRRPGRPRAVPMGCAVLTLNQGALCVTEEFLPYFNSGLMATLLAALLAGLLILTAGVVRLLIRDLPANPRRRLVSTIVPLGYRLVIPAFLALPLVWMILNQFRRISYDADNLSGFHAPLESWPDRSQVAGRNRLRVPARPMVSAGFTTRG